MTMIKYRLTTASLAALTLLALPAHAATFTLDFETSATGADLMSSPLASPLGTIQLSNASHIGAYGPTGNGIHHAKNDNPGFAVVSFGFDVTSITFDFNGYGGGDFLANALDAGGAVVASYHAPSTTCVNSCFDQTGITLSGTGIRSFQFIDQVINQSFVDNLVVTAAPVPEASTLAMLAAGLSVIGAAFTARRKA